MNIEELDLSVRAYNALKRAGINTKEEIENFTEEDLMKIKGLNVRAMREVKEKLILKPVYTETWLVELTEDDIEIWDNDIETNTREEAIELGLKYAKEEGLKNFLIGQSIPVGIPSLDVDTILEDASNQVYNEVGEVAEGYLDDVTDEQRKELDELLNNVFYKWIIKHGLEPTCYLIFNEERIWVE